MGFGYGGGHPIKVDSEKDLPERGRPGEPNRRYYYVSTDGQVKQVETNANGEPIERLSWTTIRNNYWKAMAKEKMTKGPNERQFSKSNIERMQRGLAPIGSDGRSMVLHHPYGRQGDNICLFEEMTRAEHIAFHNENGYFFYYGEWHHAPSSYLGGE